MEIRLLAKIASDFLRITVQVVSLHDRWGFGSQRQREIGRHPRWGVDRPIAINSLFVLFGILAHAPLCRGKSARPAIAERFVPRTECQVEVGCDERSRRSLSRLFQAWVIHVPASRWCRSSLPQVPHKLAGQTADSTSPSTDAAGTACRPPSVGILHGAHCRFGDAQHRHVRREPFDHCGFERLHHHERWRVGVVGKRGDGRDGVGERPAARQGDIHGHDYDQRPIGHQRRRGDVQFQHGHNLRREFHGHAERRSGSGDVCHRRQSEFWHQELGHLDNRQCRL